MVNAETKSRYTRPSGLTIRSGTTRSLDTSRDADAGSPTAWIASSGLASSLRGKASGPSTPFGQQRRERLGELGVKVVAALGSIGRRLDVEIALGFQLPGAPDRLGNILEPLRFGDGDGQIVEAVGQVLERGRVVDHRGRHLVGRGLPLVAGLGLVADLEFFDVDPDLPVGPSRRAGR